MTDSTARMQEWFNKSAIGIVAQGGPCLSGDGLCAYRGADGRACAVGQLIPDDKYSGPLEGKSPHQIATYHMGLETPPTAEEERFLEGLQSAHDTAATSSRVNTDPDHAFFVVFGRCMRGLAARHRLDPSVLPEVPQ